MLRWDCFLALHFSENNVSTVIHSKKASLKENRKHTNVLIFCFLSASSIFWLWRPSENLETYLTTVWCLCKNSRKQGLGTLHSTERSSRWRTEEETVANSKSNENWFHILASSWVSEALIGNFRESFCRVNNDNKFKLKTCGFSSTRIKLPHRQEAKLSFFFFRFCTR